MGKAGKDRIFQIDWSMHEKPEWVLVTRALVSVEGGP